MSEKITEQELKELGFIESKPNRERSNLEYTIESDSGSIFRIYYSLQKESQSDGGITLFLESLDGERGNIRISKNKGLSIKELIKFLEKIVNASI